MLDFCHRPEERHRRDVWAPAFFKPKLSGKKKKKLDSSVSPSDFPLNDD